MKNPVGITIGGSVQRILESGPKICQESLRSCSQHVPFKAALDFVSEPLTPVQVPRRASAALQQGIFFRVREPLKIFDDRGHLPIFKFSDEAPATKIFSPCSRVNCMLPHLSRQKSQFSHNRVVSLKCESATRGLGVFESEQIETPPNSKTRIV